MQVIKDTVVTFQYTMYDAKGTILDKTEEPISYLHGGYDHILPLLEEALHGKKAGDHVEVSMEPEDSFGEYDAALVYVESPDSFPEKAKVGMVFEADDPTTGDLIFFRVTEVQDDHVIVDGNHPFAGISVRFLATIESVRQATAEEIEHGHHHS